VRAGLLSLGTACLLACRPAPSVAPAPAPTPAPAPPVAAADPCADAPAPAEFPAARARVAALLRCGDGARALAVYADGMRGDPRPQWAHALASLAIAEGTPDVARAALVALDPGSPARPVGLALLAIDAYERRGEVRELAQARENFQAALARAPDDPHALGVALRHALAVTASEPERLTLAAAVCRDRLPTRPPPRDPVPQDSAARVAPKPRPTSALAPDPAAAAPVPQASPAALASPVPQASPPSPVPQASPPSPVPQASPSSPAPQASPPSPVPQASPSSPAPQARPPSPVPRARPPSPAPRASPSSPVPRASPSSPVPQASPLAPDPAAAERLGAAVLASTCARVALLSGDPGEARRRFALALELAPDDVATRLRWAGVELAAGNDPAAAALYAVAAAEAPAARDRYTAGLGLGVARVRLHDRVGAEAAYRAAAATRGLDPSDPPTTYPPELQFNLGSLLAGSDDPRGRAEARALLQAYLVHPDADQQRRLRCQQLLRELHG
jgi:tetratricopeptide (TPR) repeat protein